MQGTKTRHATALAALTFALAALATAAAARSIDQTVAVGEHGKVRVSNVAGSVKIRGGSGSEVRVTGTADEKVKDVEVTSKAGDVEIEVVLEKEIHGRGGVADLVIDVPSGVRLDVQSVSASVDVDGVKGKLELQSVSGDVTVRGDAEDAEINTVSGGIDVDGSIGRVESESVSGATTLRNVADTIEAKTTSGSIDIEAPGVEKAQCTSVSGEIRFAGAAKKDAELTFENFSGAVELALPTDLDADVTVKTFSGSIRSEHGGKVERPEFGPGSSLNETFGEGSARIAVNTFSGSVSLSKQGGERESGSKEKDKEKGKGRRK
ncbi:MAG: DUF4097 family beta strand repeat-containing protein [bacterium]